MKTKMHLLFSLLIFPMMLFAQTDSLSVKSSFWTGTSIQKNGKHITYSEAKKIVEANTAAFDAMKKAETNSGFSMAFQIAGGFGIGYTLGSFLRSENASDVSWWQGAVGLGVGIIGLHFESKAKANAQEAVDLYNANPPSTGYQFQPQFQLGLGADGVGIGMRF